MSNRIRTKTVSQKTFIDKIAGVVFVAILVFNGTFFRLRPAVEIPEIDWLVIARLVTCALGFTAGVVLILKRRCPLGFGFWALLFFLAATGISAFNSDYPRLAFGYFILLAGASVLVMGLVYRSQNATDLQWIEKVWFITIAFCVLNDAVTSFMLPDPEASGEIVRLGMGISQANSLSLLAALVFWLSFREQRQNKLVWCLRVILLLILLGTISRVSIFAFLLGGAVYSFLRVRGYLYKWIVVFSCLSALMVFGLTLSFSQRWSDAFVFYAKRRNTQTDLASLSARTLVWQQVIRQLSDEPLTGHGYGVTRFTLKPPYGDYNPIHCHNEFLEVLFSAGIVGLIPLVLLYLYNIRWLIFYSRLSRTFSPDLALHAVTVVVIFLVSTMFEPRISGKLLPFQPLFFYYLLILDREKQFSLNRLSSR
jgi:hypothetical protein